MSVPPPLLVLLGGSSIACGREDSDALSKKKALVPFTYVAVRLPI